MKGKQFASASENSKCALLHRKTTEKNPPWAGTARQRFLILWATVLKESLVQKKNSA